MEQKLKIATNGQFKNLYLKVSQKQRQQGLEGLKPGNYVFVTKNFPEGRPIPSKLYLKPDGTPQVSYACNVKYDGEDVSFFLKEYEHEAFKVLGGQGTVVKISAELQENSKGAYFVRLKFDAIDE